MIFVCRPVSAAFSAFGRLSSSCKHSSTVFWFLNIANFVEDLIVLLLPIRLILLLTLPLRQKIESALMLSLGGL